MCIAARCSSRSVAPSSSRRCGAPATRRGAARRDASTERGCGVRATASAATLAPVAGLIAAELACAAQSMLVEVAVVLLQSVGAEALPSSCESAAVLLATALLGRMAAACRLRIAARLAAAEQPGDLAKLRAPSGILPADPQRPSATARRGAQARNADGRAVLVHVCICLAGNVRFMSRHLVFVSLLRYCVYRYTGENVRTSFERKSTKLTGHRVPTVSDTSDQVIRENPASRGTETSAEVLVGPPWRMVSNAGHE